MNACKARIPLRHFVNLSDLTVSYGQNGNASSFISQISTVIARSPQLRNLRVDYEGRGSSLPTLRGLFAKLTTNNLLPLEHLGIDFMDAIVDQITLPHLRHLTSFHFQIDDDHAFVAPRVWSSFQSNGIKLTDVSIEGIITEETMLYLSSFSGLKSLILEDVEASEVIGEKLKNMLLSEVLPKHANSLETLKIMSDDDTNWVNPSHNTFCILFPDQFPLTEFRSRNCTVGYDMS
jgi:hypothetical protein